MKLNERRAFCLFITENNSASAVEFSLNGNVMRHTGNTPTRRKKSGCLSNGREAQTEYLPILLSLSAPNTFPSRTTHTRNFHMNHTIYRINVYPKLLERVKVPNIINVQHIAWWQGNSIRHTIVTTPSFFCVQ